MRINLETLYKGNAVKIKNKEFLDTKSIIKDFIESFKDNTKELIIDVKLPENIMLKKDKYGNLINDFNYIYYSKVSVMIVLNNSFVENVNTIGVIYDLESKEPYYKTFCGYTEGLTFYNQLCTYHILHNKINVHDATELLYKQYFKNIPQKLYTDPKQYLGKIIYDSIYKKFEYEFGIVMISPKDIISGFRNSHNLEGVNSVNDLYKSIYKDIKEDFFNIPEKSSLLLDILSNNQFI